MRNFQPQKHGGNRSRRHVEDTDLVANSLAKLEALQSRIRVVKRLAHSRDAGTLRHLGYCRPAISRMLNSAGEHHMVTAPTLWLVTYERRIEVLRALGQQLEHGTARTTHTKRDHYQYREEPAMQRLIFQFPEKPVKSVRALVKRAGFTATGNRSTYARSLDSDGQQAAARLRVQLDRHF